MPVTRLATKSVEKPWGRHKLWPGFDDVESGSKPIGEVWFEAPGDPELLVKYLFTSAKLSVQVHPDDTAARERGFARGKDEAWLILDAKSDSTSGGPLRDHAADLGVLAGARGLALPSSSCAGRRFATLPPPWMPLRRFGPAPPLAEPPQCVGGCV